MYLGLEADRFTPEEMGPKTLIEWEVWIRKTN
jgi:hypothetical protein